jgi:hypothetical protein
MLISVKELVYGTFLSEIGLPKGQVVEPYSPIFLFKVQKSKKPFDELSNGPNEHYWTLTNVENTICDSNVFSEKIFRNLAENLADHPIFA